MNRPSSGARNWARWLHDLFEASLVLKGLLALAEASAGFGLLVTANQSINSFVNWLTRHELAQDPEDWMARLAEKAIAGFSIETQHFYAIYLLSHGLLKLAMVGALARRVAWAYPASMVLLAGFIVYQLNHWTHTHSPPLLFLSAFDAIMIVLVWREYRAMKSVPASA